MGSLAGYLRSLAERGTYDSEDIVEKYESWVMENRCMVLAHKREKWLSDAGEYEYIAVKCAKRGNDVYCARVESRLSGIGKYVEDVEFDFKANPYTNVLFVTLTYDTKRCSFDEAWKNIAEEFNLWKANIRKKFGDFAVFRTFEAFENGYPHIHAILVFKEMRFKAFLAYEEWENGEKRPVWLIDEKEFFDGYWHSWTKIRAVYNLYGGLNYLTKYIMKCAEYSPEDCKGKITLAMCWVFRKKAFYVSGNFRKALSDLIRSLCSSKTKEIQLDLFNNELKANSWTVLGFVDASVLNLDPETWTITLTKEQVTACYAEWKKYKQYD